MNTSAIDKVIKSGMRFWSIPGAAVAVIEGDDEYLRGYGVRELGKPEEVTPETVFAIASMSKAFTTTAIAMLVDEGRMSWDDHPRKYVPYFRLSDHIADLGVTLRDLACHRTGMPRHDGLWCALDAGPEEVVRRFGDAPSAHSFRAVYDYTNIPFMVAGMAVAAASGVTWEEFVRVRIFGPFGMESASFDLDTLREWPNHAAGHVKHKGKVLVPDTRSYKGIGPCGGINASALDMSKWLRFHLNGGELGGKRLLPRERLAETVKPHAVVPWDNPDKYGIDQGTELLTYCLGWNKCDYRGETTITHGGWLAGYTGSINWFPRRSVGFVLLTNLASGSATPALRNSLRDVMLDLEPRRWNIDFRTIDRNSEKEQKEKKAKEIRHKRTRPSRGLDAYAGAYQDTAYGDLTIALDDGFLTLTYGDATFRLRHFHYDTFVGKHEKPEEWDDIKVTFSLNADGEVGSVRTSASWLDVEFKKTG